MKRNKNNWFVADFETLTENTKAFKESGDFVVILANSTNWETEEHFTFTNIADWFNYHYKIGQSQIIYFHNLKFDGTFILKYIVNVLGFKSYYNDNAKYNYFTVFRRGGIIYKIEIVCRLRNQFKDSIFTISIMCSLRLLNVSIDGLGKSLGMNKYDGIDNLENFYDVEPQAVYTKYPKSYVEYCRRDCLICLRALKSLEEAITHLRPIESYNKWKKKYNQEGYNVFKNLTSGAITRDIMKRYVGWFCKKNKKFVDYLKMDIEDSLTIKPWMKGGLTQIAPEFICAPKELNNAMMIDTTSAYPFHMTKPLPYGDILDKKPLKPHYEFLRIKVKKAKIKKENKNCVFLRNWSGQSFAFEKRYVSKLKDFECFYLKEEWDIMQQYYDFKVEKIEKFYMEKEEFLKDYILDLYKLKEKAAAEGDESFKWCFKILLNSGYGSLCKKASYSSLIYLNKDDELAEIITSMTDNESFYFDGRDYVYRHDFQSFNFAPDKLYTITADPVNHKTKTMNMAAAAVITALQRTLMLETIAKVGKRNFVMCDTDSIMFNDLTPHQYKVIDSIMGDKLGQWTNDTADIPKYYGSYGAKRYIIRNAKKELIKLRFAGVSEKTSNLRNVLRDECFDDDQLYIQDAVYVIKETKSGIGLVKKDKIIKKGLL